MMPFLSFFLILQVGISQPSNEELQILKGQHKYTYQ